MATQTKHRSVDQIETETARVAWRLAELVRQPGADPLAINSLMDKLVALKAELDAIPLYREPSTDGEW